MVTPAASTPFLLTITNKNLKLEKGDPHHSFLVLFLLLIELSFASIVLEQLDPAPPL